MRVLWPMSVLPGQGVTGWPVFGPIGLLRQAKWQAMLEPKWHQRRRVIYLALVATIPAGYATYVFAIAYKLAPISYTMFAIGLFGLQPLMRWLHQMEDERSAAIEREKAAQAKILQMEKERAAELAADNSARQALVTTLQQNNQRILHANHDIMQPMFWLDSALQQAASQASEPPVRALLDKTLRASHEISQMLSDVFHQVALETSAQPPGQQVLQVAQVAQYFWDRFFDLAAAYKVKLVMGNEDFAMVTHEARLRRVLANLLNNAILYSGPGEKVSLRFCRRYGACHIFVRNTGQGIAHANEPDRRANTARLLARIALAHSPENLRNDAVPLIGHGIGLHSTARICEELGSPLLLRSRPGAGSVFALRIELAPQQLTPEQ
jgi:signal transduction histidine kinase